MNRIFSRPFNVAASAASPNVVNGGRLMVPKLICCGFGGPLQDGVGPKMFVFRSTWLPHLLEICVFSGHLKRVNTNSYIFVSKFVILIQNQHIS